MLEAGKPAVDSIMACPSAMAQRSASRKRERKDLTSSAGFLPSARSPSRSTRSLKALVIVSMALMDSGAQLTVRGGCHGEEGRGLLALAVQELLAMASSGAYTACLSLVWSRTAARGVVCFGVSLTVALASSDASCEAHVGCTQQAPSHHSRPVMPAL